MDSFALENFHHPPTKNELYLACKCLIFIAASIAILLKYFFVYKFYVREINNRNVAGGEPCNLSIRSVTMSALLQ